MSATKELERHDRTFWQIIGFCFGMSALVITILLCLSACRTPKGYPVYDRYQYRPQVGKVYDREAGRFEWERWNKR